MRPLPKALRHHRILELVTREPLVTQEQLVKRLAEQGFQVTQATLSRDIKELGLVKTADGYTTPEAVAEPVTSSPSIAHLLREFVVDIREAQNLLVIKTTTGSAQPVAAALDAAAWSEVLGTLAGDDTILVVSANSADCRELGERLRELMA